MAVASVLQERIGLFIDGLSLQHSASVLQMNLDFSRLLMLFRQRGRLIRANYYAMLPSEQAHHTLKPLLDWLDYNGFNVVRRNSRHASDDANMLASAIDISVDAMQLADQLDHVVLFSGCHELESLVRALKLKGRRVSVVSTLRSHIVADALRRQADAFLDLEELHPILCREHARSRDR